MNKLHFFSQEIEFTASTSRTKHPFLALVTYAGKASENYVGGTEELDGGPYKVLIPAKVLERRIGGLKGKKVFAAESLDSHARSDSFGVFTDAWVESVDSPDGMTKVLAARASGLFDREKDPEFVDQIISEARAGTLGFSYDIKNVQIEIQEISGEKVVVVHDFEWRGATVLRRDAAAYEFTQLAAQGLELKNQKEKEMFGKEEIKTLLSESLNEFKSSFKSEVIDPLSASLDEVKTKVEGFEEKQGELEASITELKEAKASGEGEGEGAEGEKNSQGEKNQNDEGSKAVPLTDFAAMIGDAVKQAVEPLNTSIGELKESLKAGAEGAEGEEGKPKGLRASLAPSTTDYLERYADLGDDKDPEIKDFQAAIATVQNADLPKAKKEAILAELGAEKRKLQKADLRRQQFGIKQ